MSRFYSQYGEDRVLAAIFKGRPFGTALEVGAFDGETGSNTLYFEKLGWTTILVEPNPVLAAQNRRHRQGLLFECAVGDADGTVLLTIPAGSETLASVSNDEIQVKRMAASGECKIIEVPQRRIDDLLREAEVKTLDFVTIDVEGYELYALRGFDIEAWKPRIIIVEDNSSGTSDEIAVFMERRGYVRFRSSGCNDWYCKNEDALANRLSIVATEFIKLLKGLKKITLNHAVRAFRVA